MWLELFDLFWKALVMTEEKPEFDMPLNAMDTMFIELNEEHRQAKNAGFTEDQAFELTKALFQSRLNAIPFFRADSEEDADDE